MDNDISIEFIAYLIDNLSIDELYELYATASELLKENPAAVDLFIKELPEGVTREYLENSSEAEKMETITEFWFHAVNSLMLEKEDTNE